MTGAIDGLMAGTLGIVALFVLAGASLSGALLLHRFVSKSSTPPHELLFLLRLGAVGASFSLVLVLFSWGNITYQSLRQPPSNALTFEVSLKHGLWQASRFDGRSEVNELHVPVGFPVKLVIRSEEPSHFFSIPVFRLSKRVNPGQTETLWFQATHPGQYPVFGPIQAQIVAMMPAAYEKWEGRSKPAPLPVPSSPAQEAEPVSAHPAVVVADGPALIKEGGRLFKQMGCLSCHRFGAIEGGPLLQGVFGSTVKLEGGTTVAADDAYLRESILNSRAKIVLGYKPVMPTFQGRMSDEELEALLAYVKSLAGKAGKGDGHP